MATVTRDAALLALRAHVTERSAAHCEAVAATSESLAGLYGVDADQAWIAGLLHDWSRDAAPDRLIEEARDLGIEVADVDRAVPYLLHARVAALELPSVLPALQQCILDAVRHHTVGATEMTDLDMCVYVADMIEPARRFDGVEELRHSVGTIPLTELYARAYVASLTHLLSSKKYIHPASVEAWNSIVAKDRR